MTEFSSSARPPRSGRAGKDTPATGLGRLGGVYSLLSAADLVGDHWVQTGRQAATKGGPGWEARRACAAHVATLTAAQALFLAAGCAATGERLSVRRAAAGLAFNAATHYWADRRTPLRKLAEKLGKGGFYQLGMTGPDQYNCVGTGMHALDRSFHTGMIAVTAAIITGRTLP
jgi:hypothetical protein